MLLDALLAFIPLGAPLSLVGQASGVPLSSPNVIDLLGQGVGQAPGNIIGNRALFGEDPGIGYMRTEIEAAVGQAFTTGSGATGLAIALQYAPDTGVAGNYQPGAWQTVVDQVVLLANLTAGAKVFRVPFLPANPPSLQARYVRLIFTPQGGTFTAGSIAWAVPTISRDDQANKNVSKNYVIL